MDIEKTINNETNDQDKCLGLPVTSYEPASLIGFRKLILITLMTATTGEAHPQSCFAGVDKPIDCPAGTYSPATGLQAEHECLNCTGGDFCNETARTLTAGPCKPGYYCPPRSTSDEQYLCTEGRYCTLGTSIPFPCPSGTYSNGTGLKKPEDCIDCRPGYYCDSVGLIEPKGQCDESYYCPKGQNVSNPIPCPIGQHCPIGSAEPQHCPAGRLAESPASADCAVCPEGYYCLPQLVIPGLFAFIL